MTAALAPLTDFASEITVADLLPQAGDPSDFYKSVLDDVNAQASWYGWKGVTFRRVGYSRETRVFSVTVGQGAAPATLYLMKQYVAETSKTGEIGG